MPFQPHQQLESPPRLHDQLSTMKLFAALLGALTPPTGHATARAILTVLAIFTIGLSTVVKGADVLVGKCTPGRCDTKKHTDVYWDASGSECRERRRRTRQQQAELTRYLLGQGKRVKSMIRSVTSLSATSTLCSTSATPTVTPLQRCSEEHASTPHPPASTSTWSALFQLRSWPA